MNRDTTPMALPALTADLLRDSGLLVDNLFADLWKQVGMKTLLNRAGFSKRSGTPIHELVYCLVLWVWLKAGSLGLFARESLQTFSWAEKDALYDAMNREDLDWRRLHQKVAVKAVGSMKASRGLQALVLDDSIQTRHGKKMPGVSSHFDHTSGRHVMGQQVLTLGLSSEAGFVPLDSELFISATRAQALHQPFRDGRSVVAKRYRVARDQTKPVMARAMIRRALRAGIEAEYLLADAWFGTKPMLRTAEEASLTAILRMKKNTMTYRHTELRQGQVMHRNLDVKALYRATIRGQWDKIPGQPYQAKAVAVELNLSESPQDPEHWIKVRLLFVRGIVQGEKAQAGKHDWAVFLSTAPSLEPQRLLELYALRWAIEVYFKEAKQHLGFLKEQSNHYAAYVASIHLTAIRFCLLVIAKTTPKTSGVADIRKQISDNAHQIRFATQLWSVFRAVIAGALDELKILLGEAVTLIMETIESHVQRFFVQALQLDPRTLRLEAK
ncbi:MAG TPA: transposase [Methylococcaceae bacterium]|nr:transposase [Methylococcaceae bacterium]